MTAGSPVFNSASASFNSSDIGKYIQVIGAGPGGTFHPDGSMSFGSVVLFSPSGTFAPTDVGRGITVIGAGAGGGNLITTIAVYSSPASVTLNSPAGSVVSGATYYYGAMTLEGVIQSVQSSTAVTLSANAFATITQATYAYGTDDHAALQSAVDAAGQAGGGTVSVPQPLSCPPGAVCGYVIKTTDQTTATAPGGVKIRYNNVSLIGDAPQTNFFCKGAWATYYNTVKFPGQTATIRGNCVAIGDPGGPLGPAGKSVSNVTVAKLHLYGMTNGNTYNNSFSPTGPPLTTTGDGWDITHKAIYLYEDSSFANITIDSVIIQDFKAENIFSGGSTLTGAVISNSTMANFNGNGISMLAADLQVINNTIVNGSNAGVENSTKGGTSAALVRQLYQSNTISLMAREAITIVGVDPVLAAGSIQIINNYFDTIAQFQRSGAQTGIFIAAQNGGNNVAPRNVTISGNTCHDCYSFGVLETSGNTQVSGNTFIVDQYNSDNFLTFTFPLTDVTIANNTGRMTGIGRLSSVYLLNPGYVVGNFAWSHVTVKNNVWNFPGVPNYTFVITSGPGWALVTNKNIIWQSDLCQGCTYPDVNHGMVNLAATTLIEPFGPIVYVSGNSGPVTATVDASKEENAAELQIVNAGSQPVTFVPDSNLSLAGPVTLPGGVHSSISLVYNAGLGKFTLNGGSVSVSVSPPTATLGANQSQQFTATVSGTQNQQVIWSLNPLAGTISPSGFYTAPAVISAQQTVTVTATSVADPTKSGSAIVSLTPAVSVSVSPPTATLGANQSRQFTATVSGTQNQQVIWSLNPVAGAISPSGFYTAPALISAQQTVTVTATSVADPTKSGSAIVTLTPAVSVSVSPPTATLGANQTQQFTASVSGTQNQQVIWSLNPLVGTISPSGFYTAPALISAQQSVTVTATSVADPTKSGSAIVTLTPAISVSVSPPTATLAANQSQQFTATVSGTQNQQVIWSVNPQVGGITPSGLYIAPTLISAQQTVTVTATSVADPTKFGGAIVTLTPGSGCGAPTFNAWTGCYFQDPSFGTLGFTRVDPYIQFNWTSPPGPGVGLDNFSVRWQGSFVFQGSWYIFYLDTRDGARLYVDDQLVFDSISRDPPGLAKIWQPMTGGAHTIRVDYVHLTGPAAITLGWANP